MSWVFILILLALYLAVMYQTVFILKAICTLFLNWIASSVFFSVFPLKNKLEYLREDRKIYLKDINKRILTLGKLIVLWRMQFVKVNINDKYEDCELLKFASLLGGRTCVFKTFFPPYESKKAFLYADRERR